MNKDMIMSTSLIVILSSIFIKKNKEISSAILFFLWVLFLMIPYKNFKPKMWYIKMILLYAGLTAVVYSIWNKNDINDNYIIPILFLINIIIVFPICLFKNRKIFWRDLLKCIMLIYLLYSLDFNKLRMRGGKFVNLDEKWLYFHLFLLLFIYYDNNCISNEKSVPIMLISLYPLLFPLNDFLIHRLLSLCIVGSMNWYKLYN